MADKKLITAEGLKKIQDELEDLKVNQRREIAAKIKEAREQGDLSENAEYDAAKDEQRDIEARITELEELLKNIEVQDDEDVNVEEVHMGCTFTVYDYEFEEEVTYNMVGSTEANSLQNLISNESPFGRAMLKHKAGDEVVFETPNGEAKYRIISVVPNR